MSVCNLQLEHQDMPKVEKVIKDTWEELKVAGNSLKTNLTLVEFGLFGATNPSSATILYGNIKEKTDMTNFAGNL